MEELTRWMGVETVPTLEESLTLELAGRPVTKGSPLFPRADLPGK